jgi:predicted GIY-YIG superfamily endonuclease
MNIVDIIANTERALFSSPKLTKHLAISEISTFIQKWKRPKNDNMNNEERKAMKELKNMDNIIVVQADKGGKVVVMNKEDYINKIEDKLKDITVYEEVKDPTNTIKKKITELTSRLFKANRISQIIKYELSSIDDLAKIRGQPKLHKQNHPMRIVTCARNTITSPLPRLAFTFVRQLRETIENTVCNSTKFVNDITVVELDKNERFASLDVEDLYTNIPVTRAVDIAIHRIGHSEKFCESNMTKTDLKQLLLLSLNNSYFQFNGRFYRQKQGLPMGNTLSPILADLYMDDYMKKHMTEVNTPMKLWRYVDDIMMITKMTEDDLKNYVRDLNSIKSRIRFTFEYENQGKINFLDTTLTRNNDNKVSVRWFRKETATDRLLNYHSHHHISIKRNIIKNMASRIIQTTKNTTEQQQDLEKLRDMLQKSDYPSHEIDRNIQSVLRSTGIKDEPRKEEEDGDFKYCITMPYVHGIGVLKRKLERLKIKVYFSYPNKIQSACTSSLKPRSKSNVYQINCECGVVYNGETKVGFNRRMAQHSKIIEEDAKSSNSEMVQHHHKTKHKCMFNPKRAFVIDQEIDRRKRRIKEATYSTINNSINHRDEIDSAWLPLLHERTTTMKNIIGIKQRTFDRSNRTNEQDGDSGTEEEEN